MSVPAPPSNASPPRREGPPGSGFAAAIRAVIWRIDGLCDQIDVVWNATPDTLAVLVEWGDGLRDERAELATFAPVLAHHPAAADGLGRAVVRRVLRSLAAGRRLQHVVMLGDRLLAAQVDRGARGARRRGPADRGAPPRGVAAPSVAAHGEARGRTLRLRLPLRARGRSGGACPPACAIT